MSVRATLAFLLSCALIAGSAQVSPARAAGAYCPNPAHTRPEKVPPNLMAALAHAFDVDVTAIREAALVRCVGATLMGCYVGANLVCDKADTRRASAGAGAWCRAHPGSANIPMAATGHATIYDWSCEGDRPVAGRTVVAIDRQGYIADNWNRNSLASTVPRVASAAIGLLTGRPQGVGAGLIAETTSRQHPGAPPTRPAWTGAARHVVRCASV
jgi:hypothetical protein